MQFYVCFAVEMPEQDSALLEKIQDLSFSSLSEDAVISIQGEQVTGAEPYVLPLEQNVMRLQYMQLSIMESRLM